jgi:RNA polymerase-binding transcription factor DksA
MADDTDRASKLEAWERNIRLREQQARAGIAEPGEWQRLSAKCCIEPDCGERIPEERRKALSGVQRCVTCARRRAKKGARTA